MRVSISKSSRTDSMSRPNPGSRRWQRSKALTSAPRPVLTGSSWATTFPRRTIVKCSPRCSTASRMSEKFLAASVALTSGTESDYQIGHDRNDSASEYPSHRTNRPESASLCMLIGHFQALRNRAHNNGATPSKSRRQRMAWSQMLAHRLSVRPRQIATWVLPARSLRIIQLPA